VRAALRDGVSDGSAVTDADVVGEPLADAEPDGEDESVPVGVDVEVELGSAEFVAVVEAVRAALWLRDADDVSDCVLVRLTEDVALDDALEDGLFVDVHDDEVVPERDCVDSPVRVRVAESDTTDVPVGDDVRDGVMVVVAVAETDAAEVLVEVEMLVTVDSGVPDAVDKGLATTYDATCGAATTPRYT